MADGRRQRGRHVVMIRVLLHARLSRNDKVDLASQRSDRVEAMEASPAPEQWHGAARPQTAGDPSQHWRRKGSASPRGLGSESCRPRVVSVSRQDRLMNFPEDD